MLGGTNVGDYKEVTTLVLGCCTGAASSARFAQRLYCASIQLQFLGFNPKNSDSVLVELLYFPSVGAFDSTPRGAEGSPCISATRHEGTWLSSSTSNSGAAADVGYMVHTAPHTSGTHAMG